MALCNLRGMGVYTGETRPLGHPGLRCSTQIGLYTRRSLAPVAELGVLTIRILANRGLLDIDSHFSSNTSL
jgi:hypothetical protein